MGSSKYLRSILCLMLLAMTISCAKKNTSSNNSTEDNNQYVQDLNNPESMSFIKLANLPENQKILDNKDRFSIGCSNDNKNMRHPNAKIGDFSMEEITQNSSNIGHLKFTLKHAILGALEDETHFNTRLMSFEIKEAGGELLANQVDSNYLCNSSKCETYKLPTDLGYLTPVGQNYLKTHYSTKNNGKEYDLREISKTESKTEKGLYTMKDQTSVIAYKTTVVASGILYHNNLRIGPAKQITTEITTNDVVAVNTYNYCGGSKIYSGYSLYFNEKAVDSSRTEILNAPLILEFTHKKVATN